MAGNLPSEVQTLGAVEHVLTDSLPPGWSLRAIRRPRGRGREPDAVWSIQAPDGSVASFVVEVKRSLLGRQLDDVLSELATSEGLPLVAAPHLSPTLRASLVDRGVSFADTTGNLRIVADHLARLARGLTPDADGSGHHGGRGARARFEQAPLRHQCVEPLRRHRAERNPRPMPSRTRSALSAGTKAR